MLSELTGFVNDYIDFGQLRNPVLQYDCFALLGERLVVEN